jgi:hypothetical protein
MGLQLVEEIKYITTFWLYGIQSELSGRIYIGQTDLLLRRIEEHNAGRVKSTIDQRPWNIIAVEILLLLKYSNLEMMHGGVKIV